MRMDMGTVVGHKVQDMHPASTSCMYPMLCPREYENMRMSMGAMETRKCENGYGLDAMETHVLPEYAPDGYGVEMRIHVNQPEPPAHTGSEPESERTHGSRRKCEEKSKVPRQGDSSNIP